MEKAKIDPMSLEPLKIQTPNSAQLNTENYHAKTDSNRPGGIRLANGWDKRSNYFSLTSSLFLGSVPPPKRLDWFSWKRQTTRQVNRKGFLGVLFAPNHVNRPQKENQGQALTDIIFFTRGAPRYQ